MGAVDVGERTGTSPGRDGASRVGTLLPKTASKATISSRTVTPDPVPMLMTTLGSPAAASTSSNFSIARTCARARSQTWT